MCDDRGNSDQQSSDTHESKLRKDSYSTTFTMSFPINPDESEYFSDGHESDSPQEDQMEGPAMREEEKQPRLSAEEVDILEEHLEEWAGLKGKKRRPVTLRVRQQIKDLEANEYIGPVEWNIKKEVRYTE
jgi:hypothetical protein